MDFLVNLDVDDLERGIDFYVHAFGLEVGRRFGDDGAELIGGPAPIYLLVKAAGSPAYTTEGTASGTQRHYRRHWTPVHLDVVVEDIETAVERAIAAGATQEKPIVTDSWGKLALMADPFGHGFCFVQFLNRGYDEIATV
ncbi:MULTISPECIES: VOC family protein [Halomonadaceae]|uniref:VOC family protein n=1 Tax=Billgrantia aerodenitrificans TaxID=2733483 RepID=A0ABS9AMH0_9GAMM|nr:MULTISPECIES: VOC family protein [Halomonas]MCE8022911.1 VOC family protein [Halomonas aerodenitrificans]